MAFHSWIMTTGKANTSSVENYLIWLLPLVSENDEIYMDHYLVNVVTTSRSFSSF